ncbi:MAG: nucleoside kinase [Spirochaetia bacterium]
MNTVNITFPDGRKEDFSSGTRFIDIISQKDKENLPSPLIAVKVNNELQSLYTRAVVNSKAEPVELASPEGIMVYRRSLCFLLTVAASNIFIKHRLVIGHSLGNSYYYHFEDYEEIPDDQLSQLKFQMEELVKQDLPIQKHLLSYEDALEHFESQLQPDTALLLKYRNNPQIPVYVCGEYMDLRHGAVAPSTGLLKYFDIKKYGSGLILHYPSSKNPLQLGEFVDQPILYNVYKEYKYWGKVLNVNCVGKLNQLTDQGEIEKFIHVAEALQEKKISEIADKIFERRNNAKVVLIAGPSSSGKTTFTKKLAIQLKVLGLRPITMSLDDYFVEHERTPIDEDGNYDFEALETIDVPLLNDHLLRLMNGETVETPIFDFKAGRAKPKGRPTQLPEGSILIMEGIHGLNDKLTPKIPKERKYKIYVSALTQLNLDDHNRISTTENRLIRRMVRDHKFRGQNALGTIRMWPSVRRGEDKNIFPFQGTADSAFNSALDYELAVLKVYAEPLLKAVKPYHKEYTQAVNLLMFLNNFTPVPSKFIPQRSILREFIGDSGFKY